MKTALIPLALLVACACTGEHTTKAAPPKSTTTTTQPEAPRVTPTPAPRIDPPVSQPVPASQPTAAQLDTELEERIRQVVAADAELANAAGMVSVTAKQGAVTLSGTVPTQADKDALLAKIKALPGVVTCDDQLEVKP